MVSILAGLGEKIRKDIDSSEQTVIMLVKFDFFVGGFDEAMLALVAKRLAALAATRSPFADTFKTLEKSHWVRPELVVEVKYTELTGDGRLRHPVFVGLRANKTAGETRAGAGRWAMGAGGHAVPASRSDRTSAPRPAPTS